jgi:SAM-dependent methyltransferase
MQSFAAIDDTGSAAFFADYLDFVRSLPSMLEVEAVISRLTAEVNPRVLFDIGCGMGDLLVSIVSGICPDAIGVGIEKSLLLVNLAGQRHGNGSKVSFITHDFSGTAPPPKILELGGAIGCADVIVLNRVLQHISEPIRLLENIRSVLKVGGRIIVADVDWGKAQIVGPDQIIARAILAEHMRVMINPGAGSHLTQTLASAGFTDAKTASMITHEISDVDVADTIFSLSRAASRLIDRGGLEASDFQNWLTRSRELRLLGYFNACLHQAVAIATRSPL